MYHRDSALSTKALTALAALLSVLKFAVHTVSNFCSKYHLLCKELVKIMHDNCSAPCEQADGMNSCMQVIMRMPLMAAGSYRPRLVNIKILYVLQQLHTLWSQAGSCFRPSLNTGFKINSEARSRGIVCEQGLGDHASTQGRCALLM